ncbi:hypothetical protein OLQ82_05245, partial [Campylobacter jejuni]|nr:hypothetical protein [Campylobacter jejuni]
LSFKKSKLISYNEEQSNYKILSPIYESIKDNEEFKELLGDKFDKFLNIFKEIQTTLMSKSSMLKIKIIRSK